MGYSVFPTLSETPSSSFPRQYLYLPHNKHYSDLYHHSLVLPVSELCINGIVQCVYESHPCCSSCSRSQFSFYCCVVYLSVVLLSYFEFWTIINKCMTVVICLVICLVWWKCFGYIPRSGITGSWDIVYTCSYCQIVFQNGYTSLVPWFLVFRFCVLFKKCCHCITVGQSAMEEEWARLDSMPVAPNTRHRHLASVLEARQVLRDLENILW